MGTRARFGGMGQLLEEDILQAQYVSFLITPAPILMTYVPQCVVLAMLSEQHFRGLHVIQTDRVSGLASDPTMSVTLPGTTSQFPTIRGPGSG